ncbi:putative beta-lysine N-acetyltransferase [Fictibacillus sp. KIGAM418]|uniref:Beta-lysine N-acetyltransferase n=1 Tax=Fictibacillus marinisediminis TaxID=2878389 RepID=A0A9X1XA90_9BACL|nr:putative beta-lysine N-acetyltransferase [Fictibacillus marinisediminis]MCK6257152.1 putative beta-lysine N-acetyltransferase [Fictibacillus marinisediminis]
MQTETFYKQTEINKEDVTAEIFLDYFNERLRVDDYRGNISSLAAEVNELAVQHDFSKVIIKAKSEHVGAFLALGFLPEAVFSQYFNGSDAVAMCRYYTNERKRSDYWVEEDKIMDRIFELPEGKSGGHSLPENYLIRLADQNDTEGLSTLYGKVFQVYPTPMNDPSYIKNTMEQGTIYYVIEQNKEIVSAASADINMQYHNAELTDCATLAEHRKFGLMKILIEKLELELKNRKIYCAYSIARSLSFGMNAVFFQRGYKYQGRFTKNCLIFDKYEDMNLWMRDLSAN